MTKIKALSVKEPWAGYIRAGRKTIEVRSWRTDYRGPLLICATKKPKMELSGNAVAICELVDCRPMTRADEPAAMHLGHDGMFAWVLKDIKAITPFPVKGKQRLFEVALPDGCGSE